MRGWMGWMGAAALGAGLLGCGTDPETPTTRLEYVSGAPGEFHVGDTSALWVVSRTGIGPTGRETTTKPYTSFRLVSSDSGVVTVIREQQLVGVAAGQARIAARDLNSGLITDSVTVTVLP